MSFNDFQEACMKTAIYPNKGNNLSYTTLGLCGESGEVAEKVKKLYRDLDGKITASFQLAIGKELADVLWYVAATAFECKLDLQTIVDLGLAKYKSRQERNVLHGDGDNR